MEKTGNRAQAQIITVVLLVLIVMVATVIIMAFVIPFVKEKISSGDCLDVVGIDKISIGSSGYTCYDLTNEEMRVQINIGAIKDLIEGFSIEVGGASTKNYRIKDGLVDDVHMIYDLSGDMVELPEDNTARTYVIEGVDIKPNVVYVYPILKDGRICSASHSVTTIDNCIGS